MRVDRIEKALYRHALRPTTEAAYVLQDIAHAAVDDLQARAHNEASTR